MKVILTTNIKKLGKIGDLVDVKNGYARNFLFPNNMALRDSKKNLEYYNNIKEEIKNKIQERDNMVESYKTNLRVSEAGAPINIGGQEFFSKPFKDIKRATMDKIAEDNRKAYDMQKRQVNFTSGNIGNFLQNNIFTMNPQEKAELQRQINNMEERELYKFNLSRGETRSGFSFSR